MSKKDILLNKLILPASLIVSALIIAGAIFMVGGTINNTLTGVSTTQLIATTAGNSDNGTENLGADVVPVPSRPTLTQPSPSGGITIASLMDDDPTKGSDSAPVVIIEFSDFECPFCGRFYSQTLSQIEKEYVDTGKVQMVYRDFPLSFHPQAKPSAMAAECADDQGKFWEMHDKLFENQSTLSESNIKLWAEELGLNTTTFNSCFDSAKYSNEVDSDMSDGSAAGISGTPGFLIGKRDGTGTIISGAQPYSVFKAAIDSLLQ